METGAVMHPGIVENDRSTPDETTLPYIHVGPLHDPVLEEMRLERGIEIDGTFRADLDQVELGHEGRIEIDTIPDLHPEESEYPSGKGRPKEIVQ